MDVVNNLKPGKNGTQRHVSELIAERKNTPVKTHGRSLAQQPAGDAMRIHFHKNTDT